MVQGVGSDAARALTVVWLLLSLTFVFVLLRIYVRTKLTPPDRWAADDYYYFASFVSSYGRKPRDQLITILKEPMIIFLTKGESFL